MKIESGDLSIGLDLAVAPEPNPIRASGQLRRAIDAPLLGDTDGWIPKRFAPPKFIAFSTSSAWQASF
jgi:hypothetical protein